MAIYICPGCHDRALSDRFLQALELPLDRHIVLPIDTHPPYSPLHVLDFAHQTWGNTIWQQRIFFLSFSAGVVGAIGAARLWRQQGGSVAAFVACDGWGVPLFGDFPIYRVSHDDRTHRESTFLGAGDEGFYADPPVAHLDLWAAPQTARGWWVSQNEERSRRSTAAAFIRHLLQIYGEIL
ncbi:MAG: hypothetical protein J7641_04905 [Cyanobacteria bacterium SID2]|nr:hypothetical protein [Cyanobacteria bacterium SID2]MBP0006152.1 hypothetical protein [Cyanobacteria bacterium SBC]